MIYLRDLFEEFCKASDGKMKWADEDAVKTEFVFGFLRGYMERKQHPKPLKDWAPLVGELVEAKWHEDGKFYKGKITQRVEEEGRPFFHVHFDDGDVTPSPIPQDDLKYPEPEVNFMLIDWVWRDLLSHGIELAVEHENSGDTLSFLDSEIRHLVDLKADSKVAITYPSQGDAQHVLDKVKEKVLGSRLFTKHLGENWLLIFGFTTTKGGKPAILWRGHLLHKMGDEVETMERMVFQRR